VFIRKRNVISLKAVFIVVTNFWQEKHLYTVFRYFLETYFWSCCWFCNVGCCLGYNCMSNF